MAHRATGLLALTVGLLFSTVPATAEEAGVPFPDIAGPELWIDGPDAVSLGNDLQFPDVAVDNEGRRIHVWSAAGMNGSQAGRIILRRWDADGTPLEDPKIVNSPVVNVHQTFPRVAVSADGSILVIWQSLDPIAPGDPIRRYVVHGQAYDADGNTVGTEQRLSTVPTNGTTNDFADVAALRTSDGSAGGYAVVWRSSNSAGPDTNWSIQGCLVSSTGVPSPQFQVNSETASNQNLSSITELIDGGFLAVWVESQKVWGRRFNSAGGPIGNDVQLSTFSSAVAQETQVAIGWNGHILVVWADSGVETPPLPPGSSSEIRGRLFDADLNALGPDFRINTVTEDTQSAPRIADYGQKGFLVVWKSDVSSGADPGDSIEARLVTGPNQFDGDQVQLNTWDNNTQQNPGAHGWYGRLATNWRSNTWDGEPPPNVINDNFIIGRDIEDCLFCDDFEWFSPASPGSLWRWSSTLGLVP